jgi:hypothetical protein
MPSALSHGSEKDDPSVWNNGEIVISGAKGRNSGKEHATAAFRSTRTSHEVSRN